MFLRIVANENFSDFTTLLLISNWYNTYQGNLQILMVEVYKIANVYAAFIMNNLFVFPESTNNIRNFQIILNKYKLW